MALFNWNETFSVKVGVIDDQHKQLVSLINELHDATQLGRGEKVVALILTDLLDYADYHFRTEEALMEAHSFPGRHQHLGDHEDFRKKALELEEARNSGSPGVPEELSRYLRDWLAHHIKGVDRHLGAFLNEKGVA